MPALSAVLLTCSFQFSLLLFHVGSQAAAVAHMVYPISDIGRCRKCGKYVPSTWRTAQGKDCELILTVQMESRHPVEGYFGSFERYVIIASYNGLKLQDLEILSNFLHFVGKRPLMVKFSKFCSESFHRLTNFRCCVQIS